MLYSRLNQWQQHLAPKILAAAPAASQEPALSLQLQPGPLQRAPLPGQLPGSSPARHVICDSRVSTPPCSRVPLDSLQSEARKLREVIQPCGVQHRSDFYFGAWLCSAAGGGCRHGSDGGRAVSGQRAPGVQDLAM